MIPIFDDNGNRLAHVYNGLTLNNPSDNASAPKTIYEINTITPLTELDSVSDPHQTRDGMESYDVRKVARTFRVDGTIRATSIADLFDRMKALANTFDPAKVAHENPSTQGYLPYTFSVPTSDTTNYATGFVTSQYYLRARRVPEPVISDRTGLAAFFTLDLVARDPRRYYTVQQTKTVTTGFVTNQLADYRSWPTLTITMSGAGDANASYTITNWLGAKTLTFDLSGCINGDVVVIDMENRTFTKNGTSTPSLYVSGDFWEIEPSSNTLSRANTTGQASFSLAWYRAFCL